MGHRTNYAILEQGQIRLFYSHWGALSVPQDLFWGPDHALAFVLDLEEVDPGRWLDEVWCEGGAALNLDARTFCLFGGEGIEGTPEAVAAYVRLANALWGQRGWTVTWAHDGIHDLAACVGADPALVEAKPLCNPVDLDTLGRAIREDERIYPRLISWRGADGTWHNAVDVEDMRDLLVTGPALLDHLDKLVSVAELPAAREAAGLPLTVLPEEGLLIDMERRHIITHGYRPLRTEARLIADTWEGWTIDYQDGGLDHHYALLGEPMPEYLSERVLPDTDYERTPMSDDAAVAYIAELLLEEEFGDPTKTIRALIAEYEARGEALTVNPSALVAPQHAALWPEERRALIASALAHL